MDAWIFQADVYCDDCARELIAECKGSDTGDSDDYPQGPYPDGGGEADCPQHCGSCGVFLENPLTGEGYEYVRTHDVVSPVTDEWRAFYGIDDDE